MKIQLNTIKIFENSEAIPVVSTITSLVSIIIKAVSFQKERTPFEKYLATRTWTYLVLCAIPLVNIIAYLFRKTLLNDPPIAQLTAPISHLLEHNELLNQKKTEAIFAAKATKSPAKKIDLALLAAESALESRPRAANAASGDIFEAADFRVKYDFNDVINPFFEDPTITFYKHNDKHIALQGSPEGCSIGVAAMLAFDLGKKIPYHDFISRKAAAWDRIKADLEGAGLIVKKHDVKACEDLSGNLCIKKLSDHVLKDGPACTRIRAKSATIAHWIIVDEIDLDLHVVTIRDPWHGFMADIDLTAFLVQWQEAWNEAKSKGYSCHIIQACLPILPSF